MNRIVSVFVLLAICAISTRAQAPAPAKSAATASLEKQVHEMIAKHRGKAAVYIKNLKTGEIISEDPDHVVQTASVIKLPIMVEAFEQVQAGKHQWSEKIVLKAEDRVPGSGILLSLQPGLTMTLEDVVSLMMLESDNTATNLAIDTLGLKNINDRITAMGMKDTYLYKKVFKPAEGPVPADQKKFGLGKTTPREMGTIMEMIDSCDKRLALPQKACERMIEILKEQRYRNMVARYIETVDTSEVPSKVAAKLGALDAVRNEVAIVYTKDASLLISAFTYENKDERWNADNEGEMLVSNIAKAVVDVWGKTNGAANAGKQ